MRRLQGLCCTLLAWLPQSYATVNLSPQDVVDRVLANSIEKEIIENERVTKNEALLTAMQVFDWGMESTINYESAEREPLGPFENEKDETLNASLEFAKTLRSGTVTSLSYERESTRSDLNSFLSGANQLSSRTIDFVTLEVSQPILNNFWGGVDHRREKVQLALAKNHDHQKLEDLEALLVESLSFYWDTFSSSKALKAALSSRDRYSKLVKVVERKKRLGFAQPGELYQVRAEFEAQDRKVKEASRTFLINMDTLSRRLMTEESLDIEFKMESEIPNFPLLEPIDVNNLRAIMMAKQQVVADDLNKKAVASDSIPELNLTGRVAYRGADENASEAYSDLGTFNSPLYYVGLEFRTYLGSEATEGSNQIARVKLKNAELELKRQLRLIKDTLKAHELTAKNAFQNANSSKQVVSFRDKALKQIERAYRQGRRELREVITANSELLAAETQLAADIATYHTSLNQLANSRDKLLSDYTQPRGPSDE